jgi:hypothetical protein
VVRSEGPLGPIKFRARRFGLPRGWRPGLPGTINFTTFLCAVRLVSVTP